MSQLQVSGEAKIRDIQGPVVANSGVITALDGDASQYVRGDGTLADFPTSSGGGSSVSYYLNSSVSQGTIGGVAYRELSKDPIIGAGTDIPISTNGYVANYITDANDPDVTIVPGGNFNCEFYFSVNNNTGNPNTYAELYKYDGTTFTLLGSSVGVPEYINQGTIIAPYYFAIPVATAALALTDRLAIRIYVNVDGRTVTLHTENGHLCQVVTTLSKGMVSLNNLTDQSQFLTTGTSGTDFNIVSSGDTHTFNLPTASATNTGKLSSTDWSTFNGKVPYTGATGDVDLGSFILSAGATSSNIVYANGSGSSSGILYLKQGTIVANFIGYNGIYGTSTGYGFISDTGASYKNAIFSLASLTNVTPRTYTLPDLSGTLALLEGTQTFTGYKTFDAALELKFNIIPTPSSVGNSGIGSNGIGITITTKPVSAVYNNNLYFASASNTFTFPNATGTIALTSNLSAYVPYTGATGAVNLGTNELTSGNAKINDTLYLKVATTYAHVSGYYGIQVGTNLFTINNSASTQAAFSLASLTTSRTFTLPDSNGTLALTSNLSAYLPLSGGTLTGALSGTSATFSDTVTINKNAAISSLIVKSSSSTTGLWLYLNGLNATLSNQDNGSLGFETNGTNRLTIASTGAATFSSSVTAGGFKSQGIPNGLEIIGPTGSPAYAVVDQSVNNGGKRWRFGHTGAASGFSSFDFYNQTDNITAMTLTSGGNVGIGITPYANSISKSLDLLGGAGMFGYGDANYLTGNTYFDGGWKAKNAGIGSIINVGDNIVFSISNSGSAGGSITMTERMRITSGGYLKASNNGSYYGSTGLYHELLTDRGGDAALVVQNSSTNPYGLFVNFNVDVNNSTNYIFRGYSTGGGLPLYTIFSNGTTSGRSDIRLKKNIVNATSKLDNLMKLRVINYEWITSVNGIKEIGLIAQEVEEIFPSLVITEPIIKTKQIEQEDGTVIEEKYEEGDSKSIKHSVLPILTLKGLQELKAEKDAQIADLKAQIEELKALIAAK